MNVEKYQNFRSGFLFLVFEFHVQREHILEVMYSQVFHLVYELPILKLTHVKYEAINFNQYSVLISSALVPQTPHIKNWGGVSEIQRLFMDSGQRIESNSVAFSIIIHCPALHM